jgi:hypothetical protein
MGTMSRATTYRLALRERGNSLTFFVDDKPVDTIALTGAVTQTSGLFIGQFEQGGSCSFGNFVIAPLA